MIETNILKRIREQSHPNIAKYIGTHYIKDVNGEIEKLVLITEAGNFNLKDLV